MNKFLNFFLNAGYQALILHRITMFFWTHNIRILAYVNARVIRFLTNIDIEPGAKIDHSVRINHGSGTVIGFGTVIGKNVILRQNVTLGRKGNEKPDQHKFHPTIGDDVMIGAGAVIMGDITIGHNAIIGANAVITKDVPPYAVVAGVPGVIIKYTRK